MIAELLVGTISSLIATGIEKTTTISSASALQRMKIDFRLKHAVAQAVEPLLPFLEQERIEEDLQCLLINICSEELRPIVDNPTILFEGSLSGTKIYETLYANRQIPQAIKDERLDDVYFLLFSRIATIVARMPIVILDWEAEAWSENYRRLDTLSDELRSLFTKVDEAASDKDRIDDNLLTRIRQVLAQKVRLDLDLTGLRSEKPISANFGDMYISPCFLCVMEGQKAREAEEIEEADAIFYRFSQTNGKHLVFAEPGAGKTTWCQWMQQRALSADWHGFAVIIPLRTVWQEGLASIFNIIRNACGRHISEEVRDEQIVSWCNDGKLIVLCDGFDEIPLDYRETVSEWLSDMRSSLPGLSLIVTSRPISSPELDKFLVTWETWQIMAFDEPRIMKYIEQWHLNVVEAASDDDRSRFSTLARAWLREPTISPLTRNPLLLSTLLMVNYLDGALPSNRTELYRRYINGMLGIWDDRRKIAAADIHLDTEGKRRVLRSLALRMFLQEKDQLEEEVAERIIACILDEMQCPDSGGAILKVLRERTGLLVGPGLYNFVHKTVAEYLVAEAIWQGDQEDTNGRRIDRMYLMEHLEKDRWTVVVFMWAGLISHSDLEGFLRFCIGKKMVGLAAGILSDQKWRLSPAAYKELLLEVLSESPLKAQSIGWGFAGPQKRKSIRFSGFRVRDISGDHFWRMHYGLLGRALEEGVVEWNDHKRVHAIYHPLFWMICCETIAIGPEWAEVVDSCPARDKLWHLMCMLDRRLFREINNGSSNAVEALRLFTGRLKCYRDVALLCAITEILSAVQGLDEIDSPQVEIIERVLEFLIVDLSGIEIRASLCLATAKWDFDAPEHRKGDLLVEASSALDKAVSHGTLSADLNIQWKTMIQGFIAHRAQLWEAAERRKRSKRRSKQSNNTR